MNRINDLSANYKTVSQNHAFWQETHDNFVRSSRAVAGAIVVMMAVTIIEDWFSHRDLFPALLLDVRSFFSSKARLILFRPSQYYY